MYNIQRIFKLRFILIFRIVLIFISFYSSFFRIIDEKSGFNEDRDLLKKLRYDNTVNIAKSVSWKRKKKQYK